VIVAEDPTADPEHHRPVPGHQDVELGPGPRRQESFEQLRVAQTAQRSLVKENIEL
jgi:hypothetical protein